MVTKEVWPLIVDSILWTIAFAAAFIMGLFLSDKPIPRQSVRWATIIVACAVALVWSALLAFEKPQYKRGDDRLVVFGQVLRHATSHPFIAALVSLGCYGPIRYYLPVIVMTAIQHLFMVTGVWLQGFAHWFFAIMTWVSFVLLAIATFYPMLRPSSQGERATISNKRSNVKRVIFLILFLIVQALFIVFWMLDVPVWNVFSRMVTNIAFTVLGAIVAVFAFLAFWFLSVDEDELEENATTETQEADEENVEVSENGDDDKKDSEESGDTAKPKGAPMTGPLSQRKVNNRYGQYNSIGKELNA